MRLYIACHLFAALALNLLCSCKGTTPKSKDDQKKAEIRNAIKGTNWSAQTDTLIRDGMTVSEVENEIGAPDTSYWTKDSFLVYLYYNSNEGPYSPHTPFILFNRWKQSFLSTTDCKLYYHNTNGKVDRDTTIRQHFVTGFFSDTEGLFTFKTYATGYERTWLRQLDKNIWVNSSNEGGVDSIQVFEKNKGNHIQTIPVSENENYPYTNSPLRFEDLNFDGYEDIAVLQNNATANTLELYWLYDPAKKKFEESVELEAISSAAFDHENREITSFWRSSCCDHGYSTYRYINGKLLLVSEIEENSTPDGKLLHTEKRLINGKMKLVSSKYIVDSEL
jgi:hypothetical protein